MIHHRECQKKSWSGTTLKKKFNIKDFFIKYDQIHSFLQIWSHLLKKSLMENFVFSVVKSKQRFFQQEYSWDLPSDQY